MTANFSTAPGRTRGITLIELLIVVAIIGILGAIAIPSYQQYVRQGKRADAHEALTRIAALQERFSTNSVPPRYAVNLTAVGYTSNSVTSPDGFWTITQTAATNTTFALQAVPAGTHADPECPTITLNSQGVQGPNACW